MSLQPTHPRDYTPWPLESAQALKQSEQLDVGAKIGGQYGWIDLEDGQYYSLHSDSFAQRQQSYRTRSVNSEWIEGSFPVTSVRENTMEQVVVWVRGSTAYEYRLRQNALTDALEQLSYQFMLRFDDMAEYWQCFPADYTVEVQREFRHAMIGIVRASLPRLPYATVVPTAGDDY